MAILGLVINQEKIPVQFQGFSLTFSVGGYLVFTDGLNLISNELL